MKNHVIADVPKASLTEKILPERADFVTSKSFYGCIIPQKRVKVKNIFEHLFYFVIMHNLTPGILAHYYMK